MPPSSRNLEKWSRKGNLAKLKQAMIAQRTDQARGAGGAPLDIGAERRRYAAELLAQHPSEDTDAFLRRGLEDPAPSVRLQVLRGLLVRATTVDSQEIALVLALPEGELRDAGAADLREWAGVDAQRGASLLTAYSRGSAPPADTLSDEWVAGLWATAPGSVRASVVSAVAETLRGDAEHARAWQLARQDLTAVADVVVGRLEDAPLRDEAIVLLGRLRAVKAVHPLIDFLAEGEPSVRARAAQALGAIRHPAAVGPLMRATADDEAEVRDAALDAMELFGGAGTVWGVLAAASEDRDFDPDALDRAADARPIDAATLPPAIEPTFEPAVMAPVAEPEHGPALTPAQRRGERVRERLRRALG